MGFEWVFVDAKRMLSRNRVTPPKRVRELVVGEHQFHGECVWWSYDTDTGLAVISNTAQRDFTDFGFSEVTGNKSVVPDDGLIDQAFSYAEEGDCIIFLGEKDLLEGEERHLYMLHENDLYDLIRDPKMSTFA